MIFCFCENSILKTHFAGPGVADPETNTMKYLEKVATDTARLLGSGSMSVPKVKHSATESMQAFFFIKINF